MSQINNGGPAFPMPGADYTEDRGDFKCEVSHGPQQGMTLRDYFAAKAMHAIIVEPTSDSNSVCQYLSEAEPGDSDSKGARMARAAYAMADAMLKARIPSER